MSIAILNSETIDRVIEMAWEDRTPFEDRPLIWASRETGDCFDAESDEGIKL